MSDAVRLPRGWRQTYIGAETEERKERVGSYADPPTVLSSTKHHGLVPSDEFFRNRTVYSEDISNYKRVSQNWFAYATNHLAEGSIGLHDTLSNACVSPIYTVFSCREGVYPSYLYRVLKSPSLILHYKLREQASVDRRGAVRYRDFAEIPLILPPVPEQQRIVAILDEADRAIRCTEQIIAKLEQAKQGLLRVLLTYGINQPLQLGGPSEYRGQLGDGLKLHCPASWNMTTVGSVCVVHDGPRYPISSEERFRQQGDFPYYGPTGVLDHIDHYRYDGMYALIGEDGDHFLKFATRPMTQLISGKFNVNNHAHVVRGGPSCLTEWFWLFFLHRDITLHLTRQGAGRFKLSQASLYKLAIAIPPLAEQRMIVDRFRLYESQIESERSVLAKLRLLKDGLANDLLTGRVRVGSSS